MKNIFKLEIFFRYNHLTLFVDRLSQVCQHHRAESIFQFCLSLHLQFTKVYRGGMRIIIILTGLLTALSLASFATCDYLITKMSYKSEFLPWLSVIFVCTSTLSANWGLQTIPNLLAAELFLPDVRPMQKSFSRGVQSTLMFCSLMVRKMLRLRKRCAAF